ncbi:MAG: SpoIID/LytB domain-containing protein [Cetobacterium sp.]|nr:SpoIID/LytB domain-containing protein [Cetobacterium sp.]
MKKAIIVVLMGMLIGCSSQEVRKTQEEHISKSEIKKTTKKKIIPVERVNFYKENKVPKDNFPIAREIGYLRGIKETRDNRTFFYENNEKEFLNFYKNLNIKGYGDNSYYWRWKFNLSEKEVNKILNENLYKVAEKRPREVLTYSKGEWIRKKLSKNPVGKLKKMAVLERGKSGVIIKLLVEGTRGKYIVIKEQNIRTILGLKKDVVGRSVEIHGSKGGSGEYTKFPISTNPWLLPSGYFAFEEKGDRYYFYGGGYGHGVGMSQWGVYDLTNNFNYNYKDVLKRYYKGAKLVNAKDIKGIGEKIRVGIMTTGFRSLEHDKVVMEAGRPMKIYNRYISLETKSRDRVGFVSENGRIEIYVNHKLRAKTRYPVKIECPKAMISLLSVKRHQRKFYYPTYRGDFEVRLSATNRDKLTLINEIDIERYLYQVLPSEMPEGFGLEALKVQAIAARTYALSDYKKNRYKKLGFHITDSTQSQVYNNLDENKTSREAINATRGEVLIYKDNLVDAKYYSTSSGFGANAENIW